MSHSRIGGTTMQYSEKIKLLRKYLKLTQEDLAHELGVSFATVNRWESGKNKPSKLAQKAIDLFCDKYALNDSIAKEK